MEITDATFEKEVLDKSKKMPVVVDFWADWCGPCQMLGPTIEKVAKDYKDKVSIVKLNTEDNSQIPQRYNIMSIPAVKMFKDGEVVDEFIGVRSEEEIKEWIDSNL